MEIDKAIRLGDCENSRRRDHADSLSVHSRLVGGIPIDVALTQYEDQATVVALSRHDPDEIVIEDLLPDAADRLVSLLAQAVARLGDAR